jgi:hypothetical protein
MRILSSLALTAAIVLTSLASTRDARAEEEFDVAVAGGKVTVTTKGAWHINKDYPWRLVVGDAKIDKAKFSLDEKSASVSAPKGTAKLRGAICSGATCKPFEKELTVN